MGHTPQVRLAEAGDIFIGNGHCVLDLARESGIEAAETEVTLEDLRTCGEAFLTNSVMGVMPLTRLENAPIGRGAVGPLTERLSQRYRDAVSAGA